MTPLTVAWISDFPLEWLPDMPNPIPSLPKEHPATWEMVLLQEFERNPAFNLHIVALRKGIIRSFTFKKSGVTFHVLKYLSGTRGPSLFWFDTWLISRRLRVIKPDLVHAWGNERAAGLIASRLAFPYLVTIQGLFSWYREMLPGLPGAALPAWAERVSLSRARHATTESSFSTSYLRRRYPNLTVHQAEHAPNPVFSAIRRTPAQRPIRFVTNGTVGHRKGTDLFLRALAELVDKMDFEAMVIGGPNEPFLAPLRASLPQKLWSRVIFKSNLSPKDVATELAQATIFVLPTRADTSPNAVKEAAVAGVPVVASCTGGVPDYIKEGMNGLFFPIGNLRALIASMVAACNHPLFRHGRVDQETFHQTRAYLSPQRMAENFAAAYQACREGVWR